LRRNHLIESGSHKGLRKYELLGTNADKSHKLSLGANTSLRDESGLHVIVEDPEDPVWSTFALLHQLLTAGPFTTGLQAPNISEEGSGK
jgi:hypothetical protein